VGYRLPCTNALFRLAPFYEMTYKQVLSAVIIVIEEDRSCVQSGWSSLPAL